MSISETDAALNAAAEKLEHALADGRPELIPQEALGRLMSAATRSFAALHETADQTSVFGTENAPSATEVVVTTSAMLEAANVAVFELGMWQTIMGGRGPAIQGERD